MTRLIIVRHAKTEWNLMRRIQGRSDIPLLPQSESEARELGLQLQNRQIDVIYSSPLVRAAKTAELLGDCVGRRVIKDERLIERNFGDLDGKTYGELGLISADPLFGELKGVEGAESRQDVFERASSFIKDIRRKHKNKTVLVVSHGGCISFLLYAAKKSVFSPDDYEHSYIKNLTAIEVDL